MIIDSSALIAILDQEPEAERIARAMAAASNRIRWQFSSGQQ
jgi:uncharacterized protein with PIN domain